MAKLKDFNGTLVTRGNQSSKKDVRNCAWNIALYMTIWSRFLVTSEGSDFRALHFAPFDRATCSINDTEI